ncbi:MAG: hypothetical protein WBQ60_09665 [Asticcacaulis sp.]
MSIRLLVAGAAAAAFLFAPVAQAAVDINAQLVNNPAADQWDVSGTDQTHKLLKDDQVNGGSALQIDTTKIGSNPWDVQAGIKTSKAIKKGDVVLLAFWARAITPETIKVPALIQQSAAPYTPLTTENLTISSDWKLYYVNATADKDYPAESANATLHLALNTQSIALGPVFLLDFGPGYDVKFLPRNIP